MLHRLSPNSLSLENRVHEVRTHSSTSTENRGIPQLLADLLPTLIQFATPTTAFLLLLLLLTTIIVSNGHWRDVGVVRVLASRSRRGRVTTRSTHGRGRGRGPASKAAGAVGVLLLPRAQGATVAPSGGRRAAPASGSGSGAAPGWPSR